MRASFRKGKRPSLWNPWALEASGGLFVCPEEEGKLRGAEGTRGKGERWLTLGWMCDTMEQARHLSGPRHPLLHTNGEFRTERKVTLLAAPSVVAGRHGLDVVCEQEHILAEKWGEEQEGSHCWTPGAGAAQGTPGA